MDSPNLRESMFSRVRKSPEFIPFLAYLLPPPSRPFTPSQGDYWTKMLVDYYPKDLRNDVLNALASDPDRIVPLVPHILSKISGPNLILEPQTLFSQVEGSSVGPSANRGSLSFALRPGAGINHIPPPSTLTASHSARNEVFPDDDDDPFIYDGPRPHPARFCEPLPIPDGTPRVDGIPHSVPSPLESERFYLTPRRMGGEAGYMGSHPNSIPAGIRTARDISLSPGWSELHSVSPNLSSRWSDLGAPKVVDPNASAHADPGRQFWRPIEIGLQGLRAEVEEIQNAVVFRVDREMYHLSVPKLFFLNAAYGFVLGAFSFLALRLSSYSPFAALVCGVPLSVALMLIFGIPVFPDENN